MIHLLLDINIGTFYLYFNTQGSTLYKSLHISLVDRVLPLRVKHVIFFFSQYLYPYAFQRFYNRV